MNTSEKNFILGAIDEALEEHFLQKKSEIAPFIARHFSLSEAFKIQKHSVLLDLALYPVNTLWSLPYLTLKKIAETLDKVGWSHGNALVKKLPSGLKTRYQRATEKMLLEEFLGNSHEAVFTSLQERLELESYLSKSDIQMMKNKTWDIYREEVDKFTSAQVLVTDLIATGITLLAGKFFFNDGGLSVAGMGGKIAKKIVNENAADRFVFGKKAGSVFYNIFPVAPTQTQVYTATIGVGLILTVVSVGAAIFSDPIRKNLGIQAYKLNSLVCSLEQNLYMTLKNEIKNKVGDRKTFLKSA
ncbi:DUF6635 family protein [Bdellovibrio sp. HCB274]|uniref:DUF6635 family protein n=1 Tax=Bdellovibrio sp. HCB274 TaxID=3394361 RepID=UPI0039B3AAB3